MNCSRPGAVLIGGLAALLLALPAGAVGQEGGVGEAPEGAPASPGGSTARTLETHAREGDSRGEGRRPQRKAVVRVGVGGTKGDHRVNVNVRPVVTAVIRPFVKGERVKLYLRRRGHTVKSNVKKLRHRIPGTNKGRVRMTGPHVVKPGRYVGKAVHRATRRLDRDGDYRGFRLNYPSLKGGSGPIVEVFNDLLNQAGYKNAPSGSDYNAATQRAVLAFRKTNGMTRTSGASSTIFKMLAARRGAFKPRHPGAGRHVEVDISRQVMALIAGGKARYTYHVSTGAPATPTVRGHYRFYRRQPGFNAVGMYYSVYFIRGYATHGYHSVPNYPASHGCVRNPIPDSKFIYDWIRLGMSIYVYG